MKSLAALAYILLLCPLSTLHASVVDDPNIGITINGVAWARFNVAAPGTFTMNETDYGYYYQWSNSWVVVTAPCPLGWRVPSKAEFEALKQHTDFQAQVRNYKGSSTLGYLFKKENQCLFLPASGYKDQNGSLVDVDETGHYWSSTGDTGGTLAAFFLLDYYAYEEEWGARSVARTIRCVKE